MTSQTERPSHLPDYSAPPVQEVVIGVHFNPIYGFHQAHIGSFWESIRADYPRVEDHETLPPQTTYPDPPPTLTMTWGNTLPPRRAWLLSADSTCLVQIQHDRLVHNWRNRGTPYLHFEPHLNKFRRIYHHLELALGNFGLSRPEPTHIEVAYVNLVKAEHLNTALPQVPRFQLVNTRLVGPHTVQEQLAIRFPVFEDCAQVGSLSVEADPLDAEPTTRFRFALVFHGRTTAKDFNDLTPLILRGREAIVETFTELTSEELHQQWRRIQ